jgi:hypothetical protein
MGPVYILGGYCEKIQTQKKKRTLGGGCCDHHQICGEYSNMIKNLGGNPITWLVRQSLRTSLFSMKLVGHVNTEVWNQGCNASALLDEVFVPCICSMQCLWMRNLNERIAVSMCKQGGNEALRHNLHRSHLFWTKRGMSNLGMRKRDVKKRTWSFNVEEFSQPDCTCILLESHS